MSKKISTIIPTDLPKTFAIVAEELAIDDLKDVLAYDQQLSSCIVSIASDEQMKNKFFIALKYQMPLDWLQDRCKAINDKIIRVESIKQKIDSAKKPCPTDWTIEVINHTESVFLKPIALTYVQARFIANALKYDGGDMIYDVNVLASDVKTIENIKTGEKLWPIKNTSLDERTSLNPGLYAIRYVSNSINNNPTVWNVFTQEQVDELIQNLHTHASGIIEIKTTEDMTDYADVSTIKIFKGGVAGKQIWPSVAA